MRKRFRASNLSQRVNYLEAKINPKTEVLFSLDGVIHSHDKFNGLTVEEAEIQDSYVRIINIVYV